MSPDRGHHIPDDSALAESAKHAIHTGDTQRLAALLAEHPELATARIGSTDESRTLLHVATDWPGHFPNVNTTIRLVIEAGAELDAPFVGSHTETALHWAASSDDVDALDALLDAGANIESPGSVLGGGAPLADACGFGQWNAARRLVERGASTRLRDAAALGMMDRIEACFATEPPDPQTVTIALWSAVHGSQRTAATYLMDRGGDLNWIGWGDQTALDSAIANQDHEFIEWLRAHGARTAEEVSAP